VSIKPDFLAFGFDRFRQADSSMSRLTRGWGWALSIVKNLVELHGGQSRRQPGAKPGGHVHHQAADCRRER